MTILFKNKKQLGALDVMLRAILVAMGMVAFNVVLFRDAQIAWDDYRLWLGIGLVYALILTIQVLLLSSLKQISVSTNKDQVSFTESRLLFKDKTTTIKTKGMRIWTDSFKYRHNSRFSLIVAGTNTKFVVKAGQKGVTKTALLKVKEHLEALTI